MKHVVGISDYKLDDGTPWRLFVPNSSTNEWAVLWLQGFTSTIMGHSDGCADIARSCNVAVAVLNYAGHGDHPVPLEQASREQQLSEIRAVYDELLARGFRNVIAIGGSFGGYMAALLAAERDFVSIVLRAPANYPDEEFSLPYAETNRSIDHAKHKNWKAELHDGYQNRATKSLSLSRCPVYIIEHGADETVNRAILQGYYSALDSQRANYIIIPGLGHSAKNMPDPQKWFTIQRRWIVTIIQNVKENHA